MERACFSAFGYAVPGAIVITFREPNFTARIRLRVITWQRGAGENRGRLGLNTLRDLFPMTGDPELIKWPIGSVQENVLLFAFIRDS